MYVNHDISDNRELITCFSFESEFLVDSPTFLNYEIRSLIPFRK